MSQPTKEQLIAALPDCISVDTVACQTPADVVSQVQIELDLIEEGQEAAEAYSPAQVKKIRAFVKKWEHLLK